MNPAYDPKITKSKGLAAGSTAAAVSAVTSVIAIAAKYGFPSMEAGDRATLAGAVAVLITALATAWWAMYRNRRKHA